LPEERRTLLAGDRKAGKRDGFVHETSSLPSRERSLTKNFVVTDGGKRNGKAIREVIAAAALLHLATSLR
jgi:hypothetical protein